eukprot:428585_1
MSSFLRLQTQQFGDEDDEDEDYKLCDFAMKHVFKDINKNDNSNIALHTRSKVTLPDDGTNTHKTYEMDEEFGNFLRTLHDPNPAKDEQNDEDYEMEPSDKLQDDDFPQHFRISKQILRDLNDNSNSSQISKQSDENMKKVTAHIRIPFHTLQRDTIRNQLKQLFQLLVIVRHLSLNSEKHSNAHILSTQLLHQYNYSRFGCIQSIRFAIAKQSGILSQYNKKNMTQQEANTIAYYHTQGIYIDSMMDIKFIDDYFQFNQHVARSYAAVLNRFRGTLLKDEYIPRYDSIPDSPPKNRKFTEIEEKLLGLGVEVYGQKLPQPMISNKNVGINKNIIINDWTSMRDRFLPHKSVQSLQTEIGKIRTLNHELRYDYKLRPPSKEMNDIELSLLAQGTQKYGTHSWTKISKELLPNWTARELKSRYYKKVKPLIETMKLNVEMNKGKIRFFNPSMDVEKNVNNNTVNLDLNIIPTDNNNESNDINDQNDNSDMLELQSLFYEAIQNKEND